MKFSRIPILNARRAEQCGRRRLATVLLLLGLGCVPAVPYEFQSRGRGLEELDYDSFNEHWPAVIDASRRLTAKDFNAESRYEVNLALHEMNRLGDDMFRFPQTGSMLLDLGEEQYLNLLPYHMLKVADLCLRLGRVNEAEHFGSEAMNSGGPDPRVYRLMASVYMVKGQAAAARKFLTVLSDDAGFGSWARQRLHELDQDPELAGDQQVQLLRRRMLRNDDMLLVWHRVDKPNGDMERLLLDQLEQDPSNRMAFEFLMGTYLLAVNMDAVSGLMPHIKDMTGPAYVGPDGQRRTPRHYQEAMALYADRTGKTMSIEGFEIQPETLQRLATFKRILSQCPGKEAAKQATWDNFRGTYFFYASFGPGDYR